MKTLNELLANGSADELDWYIDEVDKKHRKRMKELRCLSRIRRAEDEGDSEDKEVAAS
jgi:hypothetical protein